MQGPFSFMTLVVLAPEVIMLLRGRFPLVSEVLERGSDDRLGRGLDALLGGGADKRGLGRASVEVSLAEIDTSEDQPRTHFSEEGVEQLASSIAEHGVLQPILLKQVGRRYQIVAGERRYRAAKKAGLQRIPAMIRSVSLEQRVAIGLIENIQREDLTPIEEALAYKKLLEIGQMSQESLARRVGKNRTTISNSLRLLALPPDIQAAVVEGTITAGHARALLMVDKPDKRRWLFERINGLSVREAEAIAASLRADVSGSEGSKRKGKLKVEDPFLSSFQQGLIDALGTKVLIKGSSRKGKIEISFFSQDDLERIKDRIVNRT